MRGKFIRRTAFFMILITALPLLFSCSYFLISDGGGTTAISLPLESDTEAAACDAYTGVEDELRGVYIASVYNLNYPKKSGSDAEKLASELDGIISTCESLGINAVFFQVRSGSDAMYASDIFPTSEYLTGAQGAPLPDGFDPLAYLIEEAHRRNIAVHAWINPLRVTRGGSADKPKTDTEALAPTNPARLNPELTVAYAGELYYDPALPEVRALVAAGVSEITKNYDIDGVIFDDYFYPYPEKDADGNQIEFDDGGSYAVYGDGSPRDDWRRENINKLVKACHDAVKAADETCSFGIAPFGIWQNDDGTNGGSATSGFEAYSSLYCDAVEWARGGYIDYLAPQIYWSFSRESAPYDVIADWWNSRLDGTGVKLYISHAAYKYGTDEWSEAGVVDELTAQITYARRLLCYRGSIMYGFAQLESDAYGAAEEVAMCYSDMISYTDALSQGRQLQIVSPEYGITTEANEIIVRGESDPASAVSYSGELISRRRDGSFTLTLTLHPGENYFEFTTAYGKYVYMVTRDGDA